MRRPATAEPSIRSSRCAPRSTSGPPTTAGRHAAPAVATTTPDAALHLALASALHGGCGASTTRTAALEQRRERWRRTGRPCTSSSGKLWLRARRHRARRRRLRRSGALMPTFAAAHSNLGAALGELERPEEALVALEHARCAATRSATPSTTTSAPRLRDLGRLRRGRSRRSARRHRSWRRRSCSATTTWATRCSCRAASPTRATPTRRAWRRTRAADAAAALSRLALARAAPDDARAARARTARAGARGSTPTTRRRLDLLDEMRGSAGGADGAARRGAPPRPCDDAASESSRRLAARSYSS